MASAAAPTACRPPEGRARQAGPAYGQFIYIYREREIYMYREREIHTYIYIYIYIYIFLFVQVLPAMIFQGLSFWAVPLFREMSPFKTSGHELDQVLGTRNGWDLAEKLTTAHEGCEEHLFCWSHTTDSDISQHDQCSASERWHCDY